jgi:hypothetical protein
MSKFKTKRQRFRTFEFRVLDLFRISRLEFRNLFSGVNWR